ncbi:MAG: carbohydrate ABC transporter permease [Spirochaetales bacterium]|jgi:putative aldouronate transport system permease protein|nr:carbohydrate ABC transporter permease [Spirochaetales bacterium]
MIKRPKYKILIYITLITLSLIFILPLLMIIAVSFTSEADIYTYGYRLIPAKIDTTAYGYVFGDMSKILRAYGVTAFQAFLGTFLGVITMGLAGYVVSRQNCSFRRPLMFFILFTMLFNGGLVPSYIINTQWFGLGNKVWVYIFPVLANGFYIIIFRTFFSRLPQEIFESAHLDGAGELTIFTRLVVPMSTPVFAVVSFLFLLGRWDEWFNCMIYIRDESLYTLQFLLQRIIMEADFIRNMAMDAQGLHWNEITIASLPTESMRYAMVIIAAGPMLLVFPFFQKYLNEGLTVGSVKG